MALTILKRGAKPLLFRSNKGDPVRAQQVKMSKWRRKDGRASFVQDLISLRKTLCLCYHCARYAMPRRWQHVYIYEELTTFHGVDLCDYCRQEKAIGLYLAGDGAYWQAHERAQRTVNAVRQRERAMYDKDRRYLVGAY